MYSIKVLSDKEFESLPYPELDTSLGVADPSNNTAYVRYTGVDSVDKYLVNHELEHLIEGAGGKHSDHYRNGVYYKSLFGSAANGQPTGQPTSPIDLMERIKYSKDMAAGRPYTPIFWNVKNPYSFGAPAGQSMSGAGTPGNIATYSGR